MSHTFEDLRTKGAAVYSAPGRVNLIGEHTDYNDGFVVPAAIDRRTQVAVKLRVDRSLSVSSEHYGQVDFDLDDPDPRPRGHWSDYVRGVALKLEEAGHRLRGADLAIRSDVPVGAGLSSSAAFEVATGYALLENSGLAIDRLELARICQRAENDFVGMRCGIMDQFIACFGLAGHALKLDCRSMQYRMLPLPVDVRLVICDTMVKHKLASSEYNTRRSECEAGVRHFAKTRPDVRALRDVTEYDLEMYGAGLPEVILKRCRHVVGESARVVAAGDALERGELQAFGELMAQSHRSLRDDYQVSCAELDTMVDLANKVDGVIGARMTGGGFGGCTINLVTADGVAQFTRDVATGYERSTGIAPDIYTCSASDGVARLNSND